MGSVVKGVFGGSSSPGIMGTGQFRAKEYKINNDAFDPTKLASYGQEQQARNQQSDFINQLQRQMRGEGPSLANMQLQQATNRNISQAMGQAASQRGVNPALAARLAMNSVAGANQQAAMDSGLIRQQEMMGAQQQLGAQIGAQRQGDLTATDRDLGAKMGREQLGVQQQTGMNSTNQAAYEGAAQRRGDLISGIGGAIGGLFSDENVKTDVKDGKSKAQQFVESFSKAMGTKKDEPAQAPAQSGHKKMGQGIGDAIISMGKKISDEGQKKNKKSGDKDVSGFLNSLKAHTYEYKDSVKDSPMAGEGKHLSPMAQELEKTEVGKSMVIDTPEGKVVDYAKGFGAILAAQAMLNDRLKKIEGKKGG